mgnify:CR=1 FL=1
MSNNTTAVTGTASADPFDDPVTSNKMAIRALIPLLITFVLGTLCLQASTWCSSRSAPTSAHRTRRP